MNENQAKKILNTHTGADSLHPFQFSRVSGNMSEHTVVYPSIKAAAVNSPPASLEFTDLVMPNPPLPFSPLHYVTPGYGIWV